MTFLDYPELKHQVVEAVRNSGSYNRLLESFKLLYKDGINSVRRFEQIRTIDQLLKVLELRDLLSEDNVSSLTVFAKELKNHRLVKKIKEYEDNIFYETAEDCNYYGQTNKTAPSRDLLIESTVIDKKKDRVFQEVIERIGSSWRDLGRSLKVQECVIDKIDNECDTMARKAAKMLEHFNSRTDRLKWHFILCDALDRIRRKELRHIVQEVMMMNI